MSLHTPGVTRTSTSKLIAMALKECKGLSGNNLRSPLQIVSLGAALTWCGAHRPLTAEPPSNIVGPMYCAMCESHKPDDGNFCHQCGNPLARTHSELVRKTPTEKDLLLRLLQTDPKPNECHRCKAETDLTRHEFAIAKVVSVKREWGDTIARVGVSAVSIAAAPVTGFGRIQLERSE
jgi:hypothetical protein